MTQTTPGSALALPEDFANGLEDFDASDLRMPRLGIDHEKGRFIDSLSGAEYETLTIIPLGMIKQRVLWKPQIEEGDANPLCKSPDSKIGFPTITMRDPTANFPWPAVGLQQTDIHPNAEGRLTLPCESCRLKEWKSHPDGKRTWCTEQHAIPLIYGETGTTPYMTALFTTQRSSLKASQSFFASIVRRQLPAFAVIATLGLSGLIRGKNKYYVPVFKEYALTEQEDWPAYSSTYREVRGFISQPPALRDADGNYIDPALMASENSNSIPGQVVMASAGHPGYPQPQPDPWGQQPQPQPWPPAQPYQPPVQPQTEQQPTYVRQTPLPQQYQQAYQPAVQPTPQSAPVQHVAPQAPSPAAPASPPPVPQSGTAQAVVQPTPVATASSRGNDDDLPF